MDYLKIFLFAFYISLVGAAAVMDFDSATVAELIECIRKELQEGNI